MSPDRPDPISRRRLLGLLGAGAATVAAGGVVGRRLIDERSTPTAGAPPGTQPPTTLAPTTQPPTSSSSTTSTSTTSTTTEPETTTTTAPLDAVAPYQVVADEVFVATKLAAVRAVEALVTYRPGERIEDPIARALVHATPDVDRAGLEAAAGLVFVRDAASVGRVVYPQLGGLDPHDDPTTGSVMVVVEQRVRDGVGDRAHTRCIDVRVRREADGWRVEGVADASGWPSDRPVAVGEQAARVLDHPAIDLPDSARWDIHDGIVDDRILRELADLADRVPVGVTTCRRGHPVNVFATPNLSAHTVGRAVDLWAIDGVPVVQQRAEGSAAHAVARDLFDGGRVSRLGAPWAFGPGSWTDPVHLDHLHLGVSA
ncbi:MAG TPA: hypothetical protein VK866_05215 [Acidimicrobiales bacterium]|nr:hypothetical protein [Acidimicrobiales bacterium]